MSEKTRPAPGATGEAVESLAAYDEEQVAQILQRAAGLEEGKQAHKPALTLEEIVSIAAEAGLDPALVRQAARDLKQDQDQGLARRLAGAPLQRVIERVVEGELDADAHEQLADDLRQALEGLTQLPVRASTLGRSLSLLALTRGGSVEVTVTPRDGRTTIRMKTDARSQAGGIFGGLIGGLGGGLGSNVAWLVPFLAGRAGVPLAAGLGLGLLGLVGVLGGSWGLARAAFVRATANTTQRMDQLADTLEQHVRAHNAKRAAP